VAEKKPTKMVGDVTDSRPSGIIESEHEDESIVDEERDFKYQMNGVQVNNLAEYQKKRR
jgi:hypothetical protein